MSTDLIKFKKYSISGKIYYVTSDLPNEIFDSLSSLDKIKQVDYVVKELDRRSVVRDKKTLYQYILLNGSDVTTRTKSEQDMDTINNKIIKLSDTLHLNGVLLSPQAVRACVGECKLNILKSSLDKLIPQIVQKTKIRIRTFSFEAFVCSYALKKIRSDNMFKQYITMQEKDGSGQVIHFTVPYYLGAKILENLCKIHSVSDIRGITVVP